MVVFMQLKKLFKISILYSLIHDEIKNIINDIIIGKPMVDGVFLLAPNTDIKENLINKIVTIQNGMYQIYGDGKNLILCDKIKLFSNHIYIYLYDLSNHTQICRSAANYTESINSLTRSIEIPFYFKWMGFDRVHFELFGNIVSFSPDKFQDLSNLPLGSSIIITSATTHKGIRSISDEIIMQGIIPYESNPYLKYIKYLVYNPDNNYFYIQTKTGIKLFSSLIHTLNQYTDREIISWQQRKILNFIIFYNEEIIPKLFGKEEINFQNFINKYIVNSYIEKIFLVWITQFQNNALPRYKELLLFNLISQNKEEEVAKVISENPQIKNAILKDGINALHLAVYLNNITMVKLLLDLGADIEALKSDLSTPLIEASKLGKNQIAKLLLECGANPNAIDIKGNTPIIFASFKNNVDLVEILFQYHVNINLCNDVGQNPLLISLELGYNNLVKNFLSNCPTLKACNKDVIISSVEKKNFDKAYFFLSTNRNNPMQDYLEGKCNLVIDMTHYILENTDNLINAAILLNSIWSHSLLHSNKCSEYVDKVFNCLIASNLEESHSDLVRLCGHQPYDLE
jgi:hypothetical protein